MNRASRAVWFESIGVASIRRETLRDPAPGEVVVRALACGVSAGTERLVLRGAVPEDARDLMSLATMRGGFELPISYGYAAVGEVEGRDGRFFCLHPHHDWFVADERSLRALPRAVPAARATLAANLETAINVVWDAKIGFGDRVVITGLGVVGLLIARIARKAGARVVAADSSRERCAFARSVHVDATEGVSSADIALADVLIEASGAAAALASLVRHATCEARVVIASWYGEADVTLPLGARFHPSRVTIASSQVGAIPAERRARWSFDRRFALVNDELEDASLDALVTTLQFDDAPALYARLMRGEVPTPPHVALVT